MTWCSWTAHVWILVKIFSCTSILLTRPLSIKNWIFTRCSFATILSSLILLVLIHCVSFIPAWVEQRFCCGLLVVWLEWVVIIIISSSFTMLIKILCNLIMTLEQVLGSITTGVSLGCAYFLGLIKWIIVIIAWNSRWSHFSLLPTTFLTQLSRFLVCWWIILMLIFLWVVMLVVSLFSTASRATCGRVMLADSLLLGCVRSNLMASFRSVMLFSCNLPPRCITKHLLLLKILV